jgi:hypothetical protein
MELAARQRLEDRVTHRGVSEPRWWLRLVRDLLVTAVFFAAAAVLFVSGDLLFHGHVNW